MDLILFHSESDMPLYAEKGSPILEHLRQVITVDDIRQIQTVKNRLWNGVHSIIAWYGVLLGHDTIGVAMGDQRVLALAEQLVDQEVGLGLSHQYPNIAEILPQLKESFLKSCKFAYKDPCTRVGRDPIRKLQLNDRVFGSIQMNVEHGLSNEGLVYGATLALLYAQHEKANEDSEAQQIKQALEQTTTLDGVTLSKILDHDRSELSITSTQYLEVMQHIAQHLQAAQKDLSAFLGDWQQCMQGIVEG